MIYSISSLHNRTLRPASTTAAAQRPCMHHASRHRPSARPTSHTPSSTALTSTLRSRTVLTRATLEDEFRPESPQQQEKDQPQQQQASVQDAPATADSSSSAGCPFHNSSTPAVQAQGNGSSNGGSSNKAAAAPILGASGTNVEGMAGPNWRVLSPGAADKVPEVPHRPVTVDESNPMGELGEFSAKGAGAFFLDRYKEFGPVFSWMMGPTKMITLLDYEVLRSLLAADNKVIVGWNPEPFYMMLGERVRESMETPHIRQANRRMVAPGFTKDALAGYIDKLVGICRTQLDEWSLDDGPVDLAAKGKDLSFEFSTQLLVDFKVSPEQKPALRKKFDQLFTGMFSPPDPTPGSAFNQGIQAREALLKDLAELVKQREERREAAGIKGNSQQGATYKNVLDYTLEDMRSWNDGKINYDIAADSGIGLIIGGNDTSGLGVSALLATLPYFPEVLDKLRKEQEQLIAKHGADLTPAALDSMTYADAVIREVLRVVPPSASVFRKATVDMEINGKFIPAGSPLLLSTFMAQILTDPHLDLAQLSKHQFAKLESNWASVNAALLQSEFKPERWLQGSKEDKPSGLLTFSAGPHVCLGYGLFMAEAKVLLALLARDYDITLVDDSADVNFNVSFVTQLTKGVVKFSRSLTAAAA